MTNKELLLDIKEELEWIRHFLTSSVPPNHILISCDGSITKNPGGRCTVGVVIQMPGKPNIEVARFVPAKTNNEAEMDAIYEGLNTLLMLQVAPAYSIEVVSDSQIVINGFNKPESLSAERLVRRRNMILERIQNVRDKVKFTWKPRNSTPGLNKANMLAQSLNGVTVK